MALKCPACGAMTLDYRGSLGIWECVWMNCGHREPNNYDNPHIVSVFGVDTIHDEKLETMKRDYLNET